MSVPAKATLLCLQLLLFGPREFNEDNGEKSIWRKMPGDHGVARKPVRNNNGHDNIRNVFAMTIL